jgi:hypothetical protein
MPNYSDAEIRAMANDTDLWMAEGCPTLPTLSASCVGAAAASSLVGVDPGAGDHSSLMILGADYSSMEARILAGLGLTQSQLEIVQAYAPTPSLSRSPTYRQEILGEWADSGNEVFPPEVVRNVAMRTGRRSGMSYVMSRAVVLDSIQPQDPESFDDNLRPSRLAILKAGGFEV